MRWFKSLLKGLSFSTMAVSAVALAGGVGCGDETFKFCECKYACATDQVDADGNTISTSLTVCDAGDGTSTYGDCGVFCKSTFPESGQLMALETVPLPACDPRNTAAAICYDPVPGKLGAPTLATLSACTPPAAPVVRWVSNHEEMSHDR
jgi:hypothetical protein